MSNQRPVKETEPLREEKQAKSRSGRSGKTAAAYLSRASVIAAMYVCLTFLSFALGLSGGAVQLRFSEALCVLPAFFPEAVPGLFIGCVLSNLLTGCALWDVLVGSLTTLAAAMIASELTKKAGNRQVLPIIASVLPNVLLNSLTIPPLLAFVYGSENSLSLLFITVAAGEFISSAVFGIPLYLALKKHFSAKTAADTVPKITKK